MAEIKWRRVLVYGGIPLVVIVAGVTIVAICGVSTGVPTGTGGTSGAGAANPNDVVVAQAGSVTVTKSRLDMAIPWDLSGATRERARRQRLKQLLRNELVHKFLVDHSVVVSEDAVQQELTHMSRNSAAMDCQDCAPAASFEDMLKNNYYTVDDVRDEIRNQFGMDQYLKRQWGSGGKGPDSPPKEWIDEETQKIMTPIADQVDAGLKAWEATQKNASKTGR